MADERSVFHVVHDSGADGWKVEREGSSRTLIRTGTKQEAVDAAKDFGNTNGLSQVVVHRKDGSIETEFTYGDDPRRTPG